MKMKFIPLALISASLLVSCNKEQAATETVAAAPTVSKEDAIAIVNGTFVSKKELELLKSEIAQRGRGQQFPDDKLVEELVQRELLLQDAKKKQLDKTSDFVERMNSIKSSLLSQAALQNHIASNPITDQQLKAEYEKSVTAAGDEFKARHILVKTEDEAKQIITDLNNGADFIELAKTKSIGPSGPKGGDLGWFAAGQMVLPFSEAVIAMEDNKFSTAPVKTQFGYHIILREGSRAQTPPAFDTVKPKINAMLQRQKVQEFMQSLHKNASIEILFPAPEAVTTEVVDPIKAAIKENADKAIEAAGNEVAKAAEKAAEEVKSLDAVIQ